MEKQNFFNQLKSFSISFWLLNLMQMVERLSYWAVLLQLPVYIAQKDVPGGLHWEHTIKGIIFFWWALVQNITPVFVGAFADRTGRKKALMFSFLIVILAYILLATQREFTGFLIGTIILGLGSGIFKPALLGALASKMQKRNSSLGWGINIMLVNLAVFAGPPLAIYLQQISWPAVFIGSAVIMALNFVIVLFIKDTNNAVEQIKPLAVLKAIINNFRLRKVYLFIIIMSGFTIVYMQFYETLPNFIYDWIDTSAIASYLPSFMIEDTGRGMMISYKWLYNINAGLIILFVIPLSWIFSKRNLLSVISTGIFLATAGLFLSGISMAGGVFVGGMIIYTFGEMITNPRFNEYTASLTPGQDKSMYMSFTSISWTIGLAGGSLLGGYLYDILGEKAGFAREYLIQHYGIRIETPEAFGQLLKLSGKSNSAVTELLWNQYAPWHIWIPFIIIGLISVTGIFFYKKKIRPDN